MNFLLAENPCVPLIQPLPGILKTRSVLKIKGTMLASCKTFSINLQCGPRISGDDIAFHLTVDPSVNVITRNSYLANVWGLEEGRDEESSRCPIALGQPYEVEIFIEEASLSVRINGQHFCDFRHRIAIDNVTHVYVAGGTNITTVAVEMENQSSINAPLAANVASTTVPATTTADTIRAAATSAKQTGGAISSAARLVEGVGESLETAAEDIVSNPVAATKDIVSNAAPNPRNVITAAQAAVGGIRNLFSKLKK